MELSALVLLIVFFALLMLNVPISFCIGLATLATMLLSMDLLPALTTLAQRMAGGGNHACALASGQLCHVVAHGVARAAQERYDAREDEADA